MARRQAARSCDIGRPMFRKVFGRVACVVPCMTRQGRGPISRSTLVGRVRAAARPHRPCGPLPPRRGEVTDGRQPVPTIVGRVRAAARPHLSCGPLPSRRGGVTAGRQPVPTLVDRVRAAARPHRSCGPLPSGRREVTDGRQPVPTLVGRVRAAARPHRSCGPMPSRRGEVTDGRQPVPTIMGRVRAAARPHLSCVSRSGTSKGRKLPAISSGTPTGIFPHTTSTVRRFRSHPASVLAGCPGPGP